MICKKCNSQMTLLFTSFACDVCDGKTSVPLKRREKYYIAVPKKANYCIAFYWVKQPDCQMYCTGGAFEVVEVAAAEFLVEWEVDRRVGDDAVRSVLTFPFAKRDDGWSLNNA